MRASHGCRGRAAAAALWIPVLALAPVVTAPGAALRAQDLEVEARLRGTVLPAGYYQRKAADPLAFELPNGFFGRRTALPPVRAPGRIAQPRPAPFIGTVRLPVVLALFSDSPEPWVSPGDVERAVFTGPSSRGTLSEYYAAASYGRFHVQGDVRPWVRTGLSRAQVVGSEHGLGSDARVGEYLVQALDSLDATVDFRVYDNDGPDGVPDSGDDDGIADVVTFEFLEVSASCGGSGIWPHRWGISGWTEGTPWVSEDVGAGGAPIAVDAYIVQSVTDCSGSRVQGAETISHEFGHALGLPDYYHPVDGITPEFRRWVLGCWDLMAAGSWGCGPVGSTRSAFGPTHMTAWNRHVLGWLDFIEVGEVRDTVLELAPIRTSGDALRVPLGSSPSASFLLVEFREQEGFDRDVPASGVLVTRIDPGGELRPESGYRYFASLLEADGDSALVRVSAQGGDRGAPSDVFGGEHRSLNGATHPSTRPHTGSPSLVSFHDITWAPGAARIHLSNHPEPVIRLPDGPLAAEAARAPGIRFLVTGGAAPVTPDPDAAVLPPGLALESEGGDRVHLTGSPWVEGTLTLEVAVRDALGQRATGLVELVVAPFTADPSRLFQGLLGGAALTAGEVGYLDTQGNGNGNLDVGDLRAWRYR